MRLLLHTCCAPCATVAMERLPATEDVSLFFENSNIHPQDEFTRRMEALKKLARHHGITYVVGEYNPLAWQEHIKGYENEPERGKRCKLCIAFRLEKTAARARKEGFDTIGSVFTTSPHKNADMVNELGGHYAEKYGLSHLNANFKKKDGFKRSIEISRSLELYRQN